MNWKVITEDTEISLHDHVITDVEIGKDIILYFEDGFDVTRENACNNTGRHKLTGNAAVVLQNATFIEVIKYLADNAEKRVALEELRDLEFEMLKFTEDNEKQEVVIFGDAWDECAFSKLVFWASGVLYCWNEFVDDAWFQDWAKGEAK